MSRTENTGFAHRLPEHTQAVWRFAFRLSRDETDSADLVQRTFVRALERQHRYVDSGQLRSWLFRITHSIWLNELRAKTIRERHAFTSMETESIAHTEQDNGHHGERSILLDQVMQSVECLPEGQRTVVLLACVEGFSYSETAEILDIPLGTVMSRLARARMTIGKRFIDHTSKPTARNKEREL